MQKKTYVKWMVILAVEFVLFMGLFLGAIAVTRSHSAALAFYIPQEKRQPIEGKQLAQMGEDAYIKYVHKRYMLVYDDEGILQWIKIDNGYGRHEYQFQGNLLEEQGYRYYMENGEKASRIGIDVSRFQGNIDWAKVKASGISFAFLRVGYRGYGNGAIKLDDTFETNYEQATTQGMPLGVYFYSQATSYEEGVEEARFVLEQLQGKNLALPIVLDTEDAEAEGARTNGLTVEQRTQACLGFLQTIEQAGYDATVYANYRWFALALDITQLHDYEFWLAQYSEVPELPYRFSFWQYSAQGSVPGIEGNVDMNIWFTK